MICSNKKNNGERVEYNNQKNNNHPHSCVKLIISCASSAIDCLSNVSQRTDLSLCLLDRRAEPNPFCFKIGRFLNARVLLCHEFIASLPLLVGSLQ